MNVKMNRWSLKMRSYSPSGVLYAEDFDAPEPAVATKAPLPQAEPIVVEPTFSLADLRRAAERAQEEGRASARREAELAVNVRRADALAEIAALLRQSRNELSAVALQSASATADTILAVVASLLPVFARSQARDELAALLRLLLPAMSHEPSLTIRVHPSLIDGLHDDLTDLLEDAQTSVSWIGADNMIQGDLSVRWNGGMMIRDMTTLCSQVAALVMPEKNVAQYEPGEPCAQ